MKNMINLKTLLRLIGAGVLTTVAASSVVACGDTKEAMDPKVSQNLGLTNEKGEGLIKGSIDVSKPTEPVWKTELMTEHLATKLVEGNTVKVPGKDSDSTDFLKNVLKLTVDADNKFDFQDVNDIVAKVNNISTTIGVNTAKTDYVITGGSFMLQFYAKNGTTQLGDNYTVNLAIDLATGIVNDAIPNLAIADFDRTTGDLLAFKVDELVTNLIGKTGNLITTSPSNVNTQMVKVMKLLDKTAIFTVSAQSKNPGSGVSWKVGDTLTLKITTSDVTKGFNKQVTLTLI